MLLSSQKLSYINKGQFTHICQLNVNCGQDSVSGIVRGDQEELFKLVMLNLIFKWYNWSHFRLLTASH
jgi:hypothetical protein